LLAALGITSNTSSSSSSSSGGLTTTTTTTNPSGSNSEATTFNSLGLNADLRPKLAYLTSDLYFVLGMLGAAFAIASLVQALAAAVISHFKMLPQLPS
jgi:hypothetical protein